MVNAKSQIICTHCNRSDHDYDTCFLVHGLPEWWLEKYGRSSSLATTLPRSAATTPILGEIFDKYDAATFFSNHSEVFDKYDAANLSSNIYAATTPNLG